jgi:secreted trypsin-like serine protease
VNSGYLSPRSDGRRQTLTRKVAHRLLSVLSRYEDSMVSRRMLDGWGVNRARKECEMRAQMTRRLLVVLVVTVMLGVSGMAAAVGIVYGEPDGQDHPHVGSLVIHIPASGDTEEEFLQYCSGTLVQGAGDAGGQDVFLTAAHCVVDLAGDFPTAEVLVTFDEEITPGGSYHTGEIHWNPLYGTHGLADLFDVAVIVLDAPAGIGSYGALPEAGLLDDLKMSGDLADQVFTAVGYGTVRETRTGGFASILDNSSRKRADQEFLSLTKAWLTLSMNQATGNGGTCYGDSGGPHFLEGTNVIASLTVTGDAPCKATDKTYRLDTASARDFLEDFVALP